MASMNDMTQDQRNGAGIKAHTITKVRWFLTSKISSTPLNWRIIANALIEMGLVTECRPVFTNLPICVTCGMSIGDNRAKAQWEIYRSSVARSDVWYAIRASSSQKFGLLEICQH